MSSSKDIAEQKLRKRLDALQEDYHAASDQLAGLKDDITRSQIRIKIIQIEDEIQDVHNQLIDLKEGEKSRRVINEQVLDQKLSRSLDEKNQEDQSLSNTFLTILVTALFALLLNFIQDYLNVFPLIPPYVIYGLLIILVAVISILFIRKWIKPSAIILVAVAIIMISYVVAGIKNYFSDQRSVYIILDASSNMQGEDFEEIKARIELTTIEAQFQDISFGFAVYGSNIGGKTGCNDITELVPLSSSKESAPKISQAIRQIGNIELRGEGVLQDTILMALENLAGRRGLQQIFVITANVDETCGLYDRNEIEQMASDLGVDYELIVVPLGELTIEDKMAFSELTDSYVLNQTPDDISGLLEEVVVSNPAPYSPYYKP